jgi:hypothetical protein
MTTLRVRRSPLNAIALCRLMFPSYLRGTIESCAYYSIVDNGKWFAFSRYVS